MRHHHLAPALTTTCNSTTATEANSTNIVEDVTCKRCLSALSKAAVQESRSSLVEGTTNQLDTPTAHELEILAGEQDEPMAPQTTVEDDDGFPDPPAGPIPIGTPAPTANRLVEKARLVDSARALSAPKAPRAPKKSTTVHMPDTTNERTGTLCNIPGATALEGITCKVCLAKLGHVPPTNAIPESVKLARKAYRSFVARATYMAYLDLDCTIGSWCLHHQNMAGDCYEISTFDEPSDGYEHISAHLGKHGILDAIEAAGWSCGEE